MSFNFDAPIHGRKSESIRWDANPQDLFLQHGVHLSPGSQFNEPKFVRLNFGTQRALLNQALDRMELAIRN